jgi:preprotein translocase subunit SecA
MIPFELDNLTESDISTKDRDFFLSNKYSIEDKYDKVRTIIQNRMNTMLPQMSNDSTEGSSKQSHFDSLMMLKRKLDDFSSDYEHSRFERLKMMLSPGKLDISSSDYVCRMLGAIFVPIIQVMHFEDKYAIIESDVTDFITTVVKKCHLQFLSEMNTIKAVIDDLLFMKYRWCILADIHNIHITKIPFTDLTFQSKSVTVYQTVSKKATIGELDEYYQSLDNGSEIHPFQESLPTYSSSCGSMIPLKRSTKKALELLMIFINEKNSNTVYIPDILSAVTEEYKAFHCTINDLDLQFIMTYLQEKLLNLIDKSQLKDVFCSTLLSKLEDNALEDQDFIIYYDQTYRIRSVNISSDDDEIIIAIADKEESQGITCQIIVRALAHVTVDGMFIEFPDDELLVSPIDIDKLWCQLQDKVMKGGRILPDDELEETLSDSLLYEVHDEHKDQLLSMLQKARSAQDIPYDILSFYLPSQWVEQLILLTIRTQYEDQDPNFVIDVQEAISGLSHCVDKTLYFTFFEEFLTFKRIHYSKSILEILKAMRSIFIVHQLCTVVTEQGISVAWPEVSARTIFSDLQDTKLIDDAGSFLSSATLDVIQQYCRTKKLSPGYLTDLYNIQQYCNSLAGKDISFWSHKLHELHLLLNIQDLIEDSIHDHNTILMYAQMLVQHYGNNSVSNFMLELNSKEERVSAALLLNLFEKCATKEWIFEVVTQELKRNASDALTVILQRLRGTEYPWEMQFNKPRTATDIVASIKTQFSEDLSDKLEAINAKVNDIKQIEMERKCSSLEIDLDHPLSSRSICDYMPENIKQWAVEFKKAAKQAPVDHELVVEAFAVIRRGITVFYDTKKDEKGIIPRDCQMVASLLFLQNLSVQEGASQGTRLMQQISTGEGKTMIICMTAIYKALLGEKVDIVTSSSVLATRDATEQKDLYDLFNITVSHCCHEDRTKCCQAYECDVVYGDIGSFQRDILLTDFYGYMIRTTHGFDNVFIDEVDSMLVDKGENMLYLPHALPELNALHSIYLEIWSLVNAQDFLGLPDEQDELRDYLKHKLFGGLCTNAFTAISDISEKQSSDIHHICIKKGLIHKDDHCLKTKDTVEIQRIIGTIRVVPPHLQQEIMLIIQQHLESIPPIETVPKALHPFVKKSLKSWIQSAVNAKYFRPNKEYIIDIGRRESAADRYPRIIIMDNETGVEQESSEWGSGLHQFLQLKHNLRISTESLIAVYMSNISFFTPRYTNIMGVTGTLGSTSEYALFKKLYEDTELVVLPTNKPSRLKIDPPKCCSTIESWEEAICSNVWENLDQGRAVLLICEDIERATYLNQHLRNTHSRLYISSHQQKLEEAGEIEERQLIIATNLAGRGTDIKLSDTVEHNGGLHVCLSYLPRNLRVEQQAYGRAARSGDPGSCKLIFNDEGGDLSYAIRQRDLCEAQRVADLEDDYYHNIKFQEELFKKFTKEYDSIKDRRQNISERRPELDHCLDCWAYFLDRYADAIGSIPKKVSNTARKAEKDRIRRAFDREVKKKLTNARIVLTPPRLIQLGHTHMKQAVKQGDNVGNKKDYQKAFEAFKRASDQNPEDPFARYYKAAAQLNNEFRNRNTMLNGGESHRHDLKQTFYELIPLFHDKIKLCRTHITVLQLANRHQDQTLTAGSNYFAEQKQHEIEVYYQYIESMQVIIGRDITPSTFDFMDWGEKGTITVFEIVKGMFPLKECRISKNYSSRLEVLLRRESSYHTFESEVRKRIQSLTGKTNPVIKGDFNGVFPDKYHFWNQLKMYDLITHESPLKGGAQEANLKSGLWNPTIGIKNIQLESWDCISAESFNWIPGFSDSYKIKLVEFLKEKSVLNDKGQLVELDLSKPLNLPERYTPYYKHIKDTLWSHSIYRYVLDHLCDSVVIESSDCVDSPQAISQHQIADSDIPNTQSVKVPKLTTFQLRSLIELKIIKINETGNYEICASWKEIEFILQSPDSRLLSDQEKDQIQKFLHLKLEIDFKTLSGSPRQLLSDQHQILYDDLCQYAVIKPVKIKEDMKRIEEVCYKRCGYRSFVHLCDGRPQLDCSSLNEYLKKKDVKELNEQQQKELVQFLECHSVPQIHCTDMKELHLEEKDQESGMGAYFNDLKSKITSDHSRLATFLSKDQQDSVEGYLKLLTQLKENVNTIISTLRNQRSTILELETPEISLRQLSDVFDDSVQEKGDVLDSFFNNHCHFVINLGEQKWSWKTISTGVGAIALGVAQITTGAILLLQTVGTGSFFCGALINEGVSDMIFGIEGLCKGHCNWSQYWDNKKMSLAITVATAGLGAVFARGREASRYAFKAFGNASKKLMEETAKQTGKSVSKIMAKEVGKKIGKKVAGAVADAGINLVTDYVVDKLSQGMDCVSDNIIDAFDKMSQDQDLLDRMSQFLQQQDPQNAGKNLHQITMRTLQQQNLLEIWDTVEDTTLKGANVITQAHGQATSHLLMCGDKLKGQRFMKGVRVVSHFAPFVTEMLKSGMVVRKMSEVNKALKCDLEKHTKNEYEHEQPQLDETRQKEIKKMVDQEILAIKRYLSQEISQRGQKIVRMGLQMVGQKVKRYAIKVGKTCVADLRESEDITKLRKYEQKLELAKSEERGSRIKKYEGKLQKLMTRTRSPKVFAHMIEHHGALLGPAFAVPALERMVKRPIRIVNEEGKELLNVQHHAGGESIEIKFVPGKDGAPGHYYLDGKEKYAPQQHGNDCLIYAVLAGAGRSDVDANQVRSEIARACQDSTHPCHDYIKRGIARNYVHIGLVGGAIKFEEGTYSGKAMWYKHMDHYLLEEMKLMPKEKIPGIDIKNWTFANGEKTLTSLGLDRCHRLSERSIQGMIEHAVDTGDNSLIKDLRNHLLPSFEDVECGNSFFENEAKEAFLKTYSKGSNKEQYIKQIERTEKCIDNWTSLTFCDAVSGQLPKESMEILERLARDLSNAPINVSLGDASANRAIGKAMDYTPGSPRSEGLRKTFSDKPGFNPPRFSWSSSSRLRASRTT